jgi:exosortase/archaeosortase family protein
MKLHRKDIAYLFILLSLGLYIWTRNLRWLNSIDDAMPVLFALPLFIHLGSPWTFRDHRDEVPALSVVGIIFFGWVGLLMDSTLLLTFVWVIALWAWLSVRLTSGSRIHARRLMLLPILAFPWILLDASTLGWGFRYSGAYVAEGFYSLIGFHVVREGTLLNVQGLNLNVEAACSGLRMLQATLITGTAVAFVCLRDRKYYWWHLPVLLFFVWVANTTRIISIGAAALTFGVTFAEGAFHTWGGLLIICVMFGLCALMFSAAKNRIPPLPTSN